MLYDHLGAIRVLKTTTEPKKIKVNRNKQSKDSKVTDDIAKNVPFEEKEQNLAAGVSKRFKPNQISVEKTKFISLSKNIDSDTNSLPAALNTNDQVYLFHVFQLNPLISLG